MYAPLKLLCLLWWPCLVLGSFQVLIQSSDTGFKPGDTLTYTLVADPIPSGSLGVILIPVQSGDISTPRPYTIFSATMAYSPQKFTLTIPTSLTQDTFYTLDGHSDSSVYSTLLGASDPFEINIPPTSPTTTVNPTTQQTTKLTTTITTSTSTTTSQTHTQQSSTTKAVPTSPTTNLPSSPSSNSSSKSTSIANPSSADSQSSSDLPLETTTSSSSSSAAESSTPSSSNVSENGSTTSLTEKAKSSPSGAIVGGVMGGIIGIILLLLAFFFCRRRRQRHERDALLPSETNSFSAGVQLPPASLSTGYAERHLVPNRASLHGISPFVVNNESRAQEWHASPELIAKSREAFGGSAGSGPRRIPTAPSMSFSVDSNGESATASGMSQERLRIERQRILTEINALQTGATRTTTATLPPGAMQPNWSGSSPSESASGSKEDHMFNGRSEMRERLEQLTAHVRRLESTLDQVSHGYDAPPVYDGSQR